MATLRIVLHGKAAGDARLRAAVGTLRADGHRVEVRVTWEPGDAARLTTEAIAEASRGKIDCIVAGVRRCCAVRRPNAPFAELVRLSDKSVADELHDEHTRRMFGE